MARKTSIVCGALGIAAATVFAVSLATGSSEAGQPPTIHPKSNFSLAQARALEGFSVYYAGESADDLNLSAVLRRADAKGPTALTPGANFVSFIYGECAIQLGDGGCAPPAEIQVWPACVRNLALYGGAPGAPVPEKTVVRGVPAAFFEDGQRLEIYTGTSTVVIFGGGQQEVLQLADALEGVNVSVRAGASLPQPAPGALEGRLGCTGG